MINFITINCDGDYLSWNYDSIEEILKDWHTNDGMMLPSGEDKIFGDGFIIDRELVVAKTFEDVIHEITVMYWEKVRL